MIEAATLEVLTALRAQYAARAADLKAVVDPLQTIIDATPPPQAVAHGLATLLWQAGPFDDLSRIDIDNENTPTATTDLWVADAYKGQPGEPDYGAFVIPASYMSVSDGVLTIHKSADGAYYQNNQPTLSSNWYPGTLGPAMPDNPNLAQNHGRFFRPPWYIDFEFTFDQRLARGGQGFPAFWMVNWWNGHPQAVEIDVFEFFPQTRFAGLDVEPGQYGSVGFNCAGSGIGTYPPLQSGAYPQPTFADLGSPVFDGTDFHTVGHLMIPTDMNNGVGFMERYFDDRQFGPNRLTYSKTAPPSYPPGAPAGTFSHIEPTDVADYKGYAIYITCGNSPGDQPWPLKVRRIRCFGKDADGMVVV